MPIFAPTSEALATRKRYHPVPTEPGVWSTSYIGPRPSDGEAGRVPEGELCPVAYLVEFDADTLIKPHFHQADQFQLVVSGSGTFGPQPLSAVSFHYSSAYTVYGPIRAEQQGLGYFTLRNGWDSGARWMPGQRDLWRSASRPRREVLAESMAIDSAPAAELREPVVRDMLQQPDGLAGRLYRIPPGHGVTGPAPGDGRGQFWVVTGGAIEDGGKQLGPLSCVWVAPHEAAYSPRAAAAGADLIMVQFPK